MRNDDTGPEWVQARFENDRLTNGEPCVTAHDPDLPGCYGWGADSDEALQSLNRARRAYIASLKRRGIPIPPSTLIVQTGYGPAVAH